MDLPARGKWSPGLQAFISGAICERRLKGSYPAPESGTEDGGVLRAPLRSILFVGRRAVTSAVEAAIARALFAYVSISCWSGSGGFFAAVRGGMLNGAAYSLTPLFDCRYRMIWLVCTSDVVQQLLQGWKRAVIRLLAGRKRRSNRREI